MNLCSLAVYELLTLLLLPNMKCVFARSNLPDLSFGPPPFSIRSCVNRLPTLCLSRSQGHLAVPALWPWHPKMLCLLLWPSPSPLMLTSKELIPQSESHMMPCCSKVLTLIGTHAHICPYLNWIRNCGVMSWSVSLAVLQWSLAWCTPPSVERYRGPALRAECFAWVRHHSFRVDNLHEVDYSLGQRKHTGFYWLTAAKLLLCKGLIFAGITRWNIS